MAEPPIETHHRGSAEAITPEASVQKLAAADTLSEKTRLLQGQRELLPVIVSSLCNVIIIVC